MKQLIAITNITYAISMKKGAHSPPPHKNKSTQQIHSTYEFKNGGSPPNQTVLTITQ